MCLKHFDHLSVMESLKIDLSKSEINCKYAKISFSKKLSRLLFKVLFYFYQKILPFFLPTHTKEILQITIQLKEEVKNIGGFLKLFYFSQWMIAQMVKRLLCTRRTRFQIPAPAPYEITL